MSIFSKVAMRRPPSNTFDLSHERKFSMAMGKLTPILAIDVVPGDSISVDTSQLMRLAPMVAPVMHRITAYTHFFFVPNRIMWKNWNKFITGGPDGDNQSVHPFVDIGAMPNGESELSDYLGINGQFSALTQNINAFPYAAYIYIWNEYYRDQNLIDSVLEDQEPLLVDGDNDAIIQAALDELDNGDGTGIARRAWQHDYFTSALPWTQRGPEATIPLGTSANLDINGTGLLFNPEESVSIARVDGAPFNANDVEFNQSTLGAPVVIRVEGNTATLDVTRATSIDPDTTVDLSSATAASINDLRRAFRLQEFLEKNARGGSRYNEVIRTHFGVTVPDYRLQRPEFLGGGSVPVVISEVLQTSSNDSEPTPQGNMAGHGLSVGVSNGFRYQIKEHGWIIGIMSVMPKTAYQQGLERRFSRLDRLDYYWPSFANIGEQPVLNKEVNNEYQGNPDWFDETFGYVPRYAEYKYMNSTVHGAFRTSLNQWHMGRIFSPEIDEEPALNREFIECDPTTRIFAVEDQEHLYVHLHHKIRARRPMPYFGTPTI